MFHFEMSVTRGLVAQVAKSALPALALAAGLGTASVSHAMSYFLGAGAYSTANTAHITGPRDINVYLTPEVYTANFGTSSANPKFDLLVFCVDIYHWSGNNLVYDDNLPLTSNSGTGLTYRALTADQLDHVGRLVNYGGKLQAATLLEQPDKVNKLAAIQGAIWQVVNTGPPTLGFNIEASNASVDLLIDVLAGTNYLTTINADVGDVSNRIRFIKESAIPGQNAYGTADSHQAFAITVPEPATWVMMIGGFGVAGVMLRRSRRTVATA